MKQIKGIKIVNTNNILLKREELSRYTKYQLNGIELIIDKLPNDFIISSDDKLEAVNDPEIIGYNNNGIHYTIEEWHKMPKTFSNDDGPEHIRIVLDNLEKFKDAIPIYSDETIESVNIEIIGYVEDTGSQFIDSSVKLGLFSNKSHFVVHGNRITMDEYLLLSEKYKNHAKFGKPNDNYLRFTKVNNKYCFYDGYPFKNNAYISVHSSLHDAKEKESEIRKIVKNVVDRAVFKERLTEFKAVDLLSKLRILPESEELNKIIDDLNDYISNI